MTLIAIVVTAIGILVLINMLKEISRQEEVYKNCTHEFEFMWSELSTKGSPLKTTYRCKKCGLIDTIPERREE